MKELNAANAGRAEDVIVVEEPKTGTKQTADPDPQVENPEFLEKTQIKAHTKEELEALTVNQLKDLAEKEKIELTKARKDEIISEILGE